MAKVLKSKVFDIKGKEVKEIGLREDIFGVKWNPHIVKLALERQMANERNTVAHTKTRGEVRGSTKKMWKQKHTGRARQGARTAPHWKGGGVAFGPRSDRNFSKDMPKKERRLALLSVMSYLFENGKLKVVESPKFSEPKTKEAKQIIEVFDLKRKNLWIELDKYQNTFLSFRNLEGQKVIKPHVLNVKDLAFSNNVIIFEESIEEIYRVYGKSICKKENLYLKSEKSSSVQSPSKNEDATSDVRNGDTETITKEGDAE